MSVARTTPSAPTIRNTKPNKGLNCSKNPVTPQRTQVSANREIPRMATLKYFILTILPETLRVKLG